MTLHIEYNEIKSIVKQAFLSIGLQEKKAERCAEIHIENNAAGVESHGLNRIPRFAEYVRKGWVDIHADPLLIRRKGVVENYDGQLGIGVLNADYCMNRAIELAKENGIGCVALKNTTHWMRGGYYAWQAAKAGVIGICWTNTESCMPMWGSKTPGVGNNPFCIAIPRKKGPVVLDMAMSQYSYGKIGSYRMQGKELPFPGGFDSEGRLTSDPSEIEKSGRILPIGYWKGSGMAIALDLAAAAMANGKTGSDLDSENRGSCTGCCQIFIAYDPCLFGDEEEIQMKWDARVAAADAGEPVSSTAGVTCPGERTSAVYASNMKNGIPVEDSVWEQVKTLASGSLDVSDISSVCIQTSLGGGSDKNPDSART